MLVVLSISACTQQPIRYADPDPTATSDALSLDDKQASEDAITVVNVLGDDFSVGSDVADEPAWPQIMARMQGWTVNVSAIARTGYVTAPEGQQTFQRRLTDDELLANATADLVIVAGGLNDVEVGKKRVGEAATSLLSAVRRSFPGADIVLLSPWSVGRAGNRTASLSRELATVSRRAGAEFIDVSDYFVGARKNDVEGFRPTRAGEQLIVERLSEDLALKGLPRPMRGKSNSSCADLEGRWLKPVVGRHRQAGHLLVSRLADRLVRRTCRSRRAR